MNYLKCSLIAVACFGLCTTSAYSSPAKDFEKTITKEFDIKADGTVRISNKYGDIDVQTWDAAKVKVEVTITVDTRSQEKANETFDRIDIEFSNSPSEVSAATDINTISDWKKWFGSNTDKFEINYVVHAPPAAELDLENKYGDIYAVHMRGEASIILKYGNLRLDGFDGDVSLQLAYGKGSLTSAGDLDLDLSYSTLRCGQLEDVTIESKYSNFEVESAKDVRSNSGYDNYKFSQVASFDNVGKYDDVIIGTAGTVDIETKYTNLSLDELTNEADLQLKYGGLKMKHVARGFSNIEVESSYTAVSIHVDESAQFNLEVYTKHCDVRDSGIEVYFEQRKPTEVELKGFRGSRDASALISIEMEYGNLTIN